MTAVDYHKLYEEAIKSYKNGDYEDAMALFDRVAQVRPDSKHLMYSMAMCLLALGKPDEAARLYEKLMAFQSPEAQKLQTALHAKIVEKKWALHHPQSHSGDDLPKGHHPHPEPRTRPEHRSPNMQPPPPHPAHGPQPEYHAFHEQHGTQAPRSAHPHQGHHHVAHPDLHKPISSLSAGALSESMLRDGPNYWLIGGAATLAALTLVLLTAVFVTFRGGSREDAPTGDLVSAITALLGPERPIEVMCFYPAGEDASYQFAVLKESAAGEQTPGHLDHEDCVGKAVVANWPALASRASKSFRMAVSRQKNAYKQAEVCIFVLPLQEAAPASESEQSIESFQPGAARDLAALTSSCGQPSAEEPWETGCSAHWWGVTGVLTDPAGAIQCLLFRTSTGK
ncbi:MAG: Tetratricopeptide repeat protein [Candidatus Hydrogenedentes bacterium]|nr:Tetratricopeptide repeat protein [Candidatus Hydrogenedentota bacterium]